jgi:hypothetical protein
MAERVAQAARLMISDQPGDACGAATCNFFA